MQSPHKHGSHSRAGLCVYDRIQKGRYLLQTPRHPEQERDKVARAFLLRSYHIQRNLLEHDGLRTQTRCGVLCFVCRRAHMSQGGCNDVKAHAAPLRPIPNQNTPMGVWGRCAYSGQLIRKKTDGLVPRIHEGTF